MQYPCDVTRSFQCFFNASSVRRALLQTTARIEGAELGRSRHVCRWCAMAVSYRAPSCPSELNRAASGSIASVAGTPVLPLQSPRRSAPVIVIWSRLRRDGRVPSNVTGGFLKTRVPLARSTSARVNWDIPSALRRKRLHWWARSLQPEAVCHGTLTSVPLCKLYNTVVVPFYSRARVVRALSQYQRWLGPI